MYLIKRITTLIEKYSLFCSSLHVCLHPYS
jgi:hypothetical protein